MKINHESDFFICHASEDKDRAESLAKYLEKGGFKVWLDIDKIQPGDSISAVIEDALSRTAVVIALLSPDFFKKRWTLQELNTVLKYRKETQEKVLIPVYHNLTPESLADEYAELADLFGLSTKDGLQKIAQEIMMTLGQSTVEIGAHDAILKNRNIPSYSIFTLNDMHTPYRKMYEVEVLLNRPNLKHHEVLDLIREIIEDTKTVELYSREDARLRWAGKLPTAIIMFVYPTLHDQKERNHLCRVQWLNPEPGEATAPRHFGGNSIGEDIYVDWPNYYEKAALQNSTGALRKDRFLWETKDMLDRLRPIMDDVAQLVSGFKSGSLAAVDFSNAMEAHEKIVSEVYDRANRFGLPPVELQELGQTFQNTVSAAHDAFITFVYPRDDDTWERRLWVIGDGLKRYQEQLHIFDETVA